MSMSDASPPGVADPVHNVLTGTATKYLLLAVNVGLGIFMMPFTLRHLGTADYGLWMLVASLTYYFQLLDLGYGSGLVRHVSDADAHRDTVRVNQILSTFVIVYAGLGLAAAAGVVAIIFLVIPHFPNLPSDQIGRAQVLLAVMGLRVAVGFPMTVFGAVTTARQRFALNNVVAIGVALANGLATYFVLAAGYGLLPLVATTTAVNVVSYAAYGLTAKHVFPELQLRRSLFSRNLVSEVTAYSVYLFIIDIAIQIGFNLDNVVVGAFWGTSAVALYAVALRLADYQRQLCNQFNGLLFPVVVRFGADQRRESLRRLMVDGTRIALTLVIGLTVCLVAYGSALIRCWMGPGFDGSVAPLYVLALTGVVLVGQGPLGNVLLGVGRHRLVAFVSLAEAVANLALSLALVRRYGILGVAIGTAVPVFVANLFVLVPAACRQVETTVWSFARASLAPAVIGAVPAAFTAMLLNRAAPPDSIPMILLEGATTSLVYMAMVVGVGLEPAVRRHYLHHLRRTLSAMNRTGLPAEAVAKADI
jgi:O-antigen/teichoic acid export membrane protein